METKVCKKCGRELPLENFYVNKSLKGGHDNTCKECKNTYAKDWQKKNREKKYKIYTNKELAKFTPRDLMLELKARGYEGELVFIEHIVKEHRINLNKLD